MYGRLGGYWRSLESIGAYKKVGVLGRWGIYVFLGMLPRLWRRVLCCMFLVVLVGPLGWAVVVSGSRLFVLV